MNNEVKLTLLEMRYKFEKLLKKGTVMSMEKFYLLHEKQGLTIYLLKTLHTELTFISLCEVERSALSPSNLLLEDVEEELAVEAAYIESNNGIEHAINTINYALEL